MPALAACFGQGHDRVVARMAHHGDAVGLGGNRVAQLRGHLFRLPAGEDVFDGCADVGRHGLRALVDDGGEGVAGVTAGEEADLDAAGPLVALGSRGCLPGRRSVRPGRLPGAAAGAACGVAHALAAVARPAETPAVPSKRMNSRRLRPSFSLMKCDPFLC